MTSIDVHFENGNPRYQGLYFPGQQISGKVLITLTEPKKTKGFFLYIIIINSN